MERSCGLVPRNPVKSSGIRLASENPNRSGLGLPAAEEAADSTTSWLSTSNRRLWPGEEASF